MCEHGQGARREPVSWAMRSGRGCCIVNVDAAESFRGQSVVKEELIHSIKEMLAIYIHPRQTLIGRSAAAAVAIDVSYPHSGPSVVWQQNSLL
jgi:hypothetical protein